MNTFSIRLFTNKYRGNVKVQWRRIILFLHGERRFVSAASTKRKAKLIEVGRFEDQKIEDYPVGQHFLHRVFGYRGVILYPWSTKVYDRDIADEGLLEKRTFGLPKNQHNVRGRIDTYYSVLIDQTDWPYVTTYSRYLEPVSHSVQLDDQQCPGFDHVAHEDVLPYTSSDPLSHNLFSSFFEQVTSDDGKNPRYVTKELLKSWTKRNSEHLRLSNVHRKTTDGVRVTAIPFYVGHQHQAKSTEYTWRYVVRLENFSNETVTLRERQWRVFSVSGRLEEYKGRGVVEQEPILSKIHRAYQYGSSKALKSPSGHMWGSFTMERENGERFKVEIPAFTLESKIEDVTETIFV